MSEPIDFRKNKHVNIDRRDANDHPAANFSKEMQRKMGESLCPAGFAYEATATVQLFFKKDESGLGHTQYAFICSVAGFQMIPEHQADAAMKTLNAELMRQYGRKVPEWRKT